MILDLNDTIDLLASESSKRQAAFPFEREIRLCQFQTWIYFPRDSKMLKIAGRLAATKMLERIEKDYLASRGKRRITAHRLEDLLENSDDYRALYDAVIGRHGSWTRLLRTIPPREFDNEIRKRRKTVETVCEMIDYRFRYLEHGGLNKQEANISHSEVYVYASRKKLSGKTIRSRWSDNKDSAVFLYVSEKPDFRFYPPGIGRRAFLDTLSKEVADLPKIRRFFGACAYVAERIDGPNSKTTTIRIPACIERVRPNTTPLSEDERLRLIDYKTKYQNMRLS
jgi:hypothetical protein